MPAENNEQAGTHNNASIYSRPYIIIHYTVSNVAGSQKKVFFVTLESRIVREQTQYLFLPDADALHVNGPEQVKANEVN